MLQLAQKLAAKPSDNQIRAVRIGFAIILFLVILLGWNVTEVQFGLPQELKYILFIFPMIGLVRGIFDPGLFRKKIWKYVITGLGMLMFIYSLVFLEDIVPVSKVSLPAVSGEINISTLNIKSQNDSPFTLSTDNFFGFFGFFLIFIGFFLNGKNITVKNERYGEKVIKIRV
jgi:hypothetical protein